jgi:hypothetical protein
LTEVVWIQADRGVRFLTPRTLERKGKAREGKERQDKIRKDKEGIRGR